MFRSIIDKKCGKCNVLFVNELETMSNTVNSSQSFHSVLTAISIEFFLHGEKGLVETTLKSYSTLNPRQEFSNKYLHKGDKNC